MQLVEHRVELKIVAGLPQVAIQLPKPVQHPAFQFRHLVHADAFAFVEPGQVAQQVAQRVPEPAVDVGVSFQNLRPNAQVLGIVRADDPQPEDIGAVLIDHVLGRDDVARGF